MHNVMRPSGESSPARPPRQPTDQHPAPESDVGHACPRRAWSNALPPMVASPSQPVPAAPREATFSSTHSNGWCTSRSHRGPNHRLSTVCRARVKHLLPLLGLFKGEWGLHVAAIAVAVEPAVEPLKAKPLPLIPVDRLQDDQPETGDTDAFVEYPLRLGAVMQCQRDESGVERGIDKRQPGVQVAQHHRVRQNLIQGLDAGRSYALIEGNRVLRQGAVRLDLWGALS